MIVVLVAAASCETTTEASLSADDASASNDTTLPPFLDATASKLVRYRTKAPVTYYRYKSGPPKRPRPRVKIPKRKYGPPTYSISEPPGYYKKAPEIYTSTQSYKPTYSFEEIHYDVSSEYPHLSDYESQVMDVDFYGETYSKKKTPQFEYAKPQKSPPQKVYEAPKEVAYNPYDTYREEEYKPQFHPKQEIHYEVSFHEEPPTKKYESPKYAPAPAPQKEEYDQFPPYSPPYNQHPPEQVPFQVVDHKYEAPPSSYHPVEQPSLYASFDKKPHFAEPPTNFHYTHAPSYDIDSMPPKQEKLPNTYGPPPDAKYGPPPSDTYGPPSQMFTPPTYGPPPLFKDEPHDQFKAPIDSYHQPSGGGQFAEPPGAYLPPAHHPDDLPLTKNHMPPGYDYPKNSYEVPLYDPVPFESSTPGQDYFPPNYNVRPPPLNEHASESNHKVQQFLPQPHRPNTATAATTTTQKQADPVPEANNKVHRFTPQNHVNRYETSSKYATKTKESESEAPTSKYLDKIVSTTSTFRSRRKRKRTKAPATAPHNLDTPELKNAFETGHDEANEPTDLKENLNPTKNQLESLSPVRLLTDFSPSQAWNPIRIHPKQANPPRGQRIADDALDELKNIEVLSIEKSRSHSYYAGTVPTTTSRTKTFSSRVRSFTPTTAFTQADVPQSTRRLPVDKTYFKTRDNEEDYVYDGTGELPKNHKLF